MFNGCPAISDRKPFGSAEIRDTYQGSVDYEDLSIGTSSRPSVESDVIMTGEAESFEK